MNLNLQIIKEELRPLEFESSYSNERTSLPCTYPLPFEPGVAFIAGPAYIAKAHDLPEEPFEEGPASSACISLVVIGRPPERYLHAPFSVLWTSGEDDGTGAQKTSVPALLEKLLAIFQRYYVWEARMQKAIDDRLPVKELGLISMPFVQNPIYFQGASFKVIFHLVNPALKDGSQRWLDYLDSYDGMAPIPDNTYITMDGINFLLNDPEYIAASKATGPTYFSGEKNRDTPMLFLNIGDSEDNYVARLCFDELEHPFADKDYAILDILGRYIRKALHGEDVDPFNRPQDLDYVMENLLGHHLIPADRISSMLQAFQWQVEDMYFCIVLESQTEDHSRSTLNGLALTLMTHLPSECYLVFKGQLVFVFNLTRINLSRDSVLQRIAPLLRDYYLYAGTSTPFNDFKDLYYFYLQACCALSLGHEADPTYWYFRYEDYYLMDMVRRCRGSQITAALCPIGLKRLIDYDAEHSTGYTGLLRSYLEHEMNIAETVRAGYMHRNTFLYRLKRIKEISGLNLDNADRRFEVLLAFKIMDADKTA